MADEAGRFWSRQARRLTRRVNFGFWFTSWAKAALVTSVVASPLLVLARRHGGTPSLAVAALIVLAGMAIVAVVRMRQQRYSEADGLVRLESALGLDSRLSAAAAGVGDWPPVGLFRAPCHWNLRRLVGPILFALGFPVAAALVPVSPVEVTSPGHPEPPLSWKQTEEWLKGLEENPVVRPESLESFEERLEQLRAQPEGSWYRENNLEAAETLRDQLRTEVRALSTDLDAAASALERAEAEAGATVNSLEGSVRSLESRGLALRPDLLKRLKEVAQRRRLPPLEASSLRDSLREGAGFCRSTLRECREGDKDCFAVARRRGGAGRGGVDRGPGTAPLTLDPEAVTREVGRLEGVASEDLRQAALGDLVATSNARPQVDRRSPRAMTGGAATTGRGGDPVGRSVLTPEERRVLERYFAK